MAKKCPTCRTEVPHDTRHCPNCPYSFPEETDAPSGTISVQWSPLPLFLFAVAAAALFVVWFIVGKTPDRERGGSGADNALVERLSGASQPVARRPSVAAPPEAGAGASDVEVVDEAEPGPVVISVQKSRRPAPPPVKEWRLRGYVYDLTSFRPVAGARIIFSDVRTNARYETRTDAAGRYRTVLRPLADGGYSTAVSKSGYASTYLDPGTEGVREKSAAERRTLCRELVDVILQPATLEPNGGDPLVTDFYLAPLNCR